MSPEARQHPQVQADLAQARDVVAETHTKAGESDFTSGSVVTNGLPAGITSSSAYGATGISSRSSSAHHNSSRTKSSATSHVVGAGAYPTVRWNPNREGTPVRTPEQAEAIAKEHGVHIPDWVKFRPVPSEFYGEDKWAQYCYFGPSTKYVSLKLLLDPDGTLSVGFDERLLHSDEGIVGVFAHEMHEVNALYEILRHGDSISFATLERLIQPPHGRLHQEAWDISDAKIKQMRKDGYDARTRKF
ncbi:hypothetical protein [Prosthecobacter sp.]|uniref:hypothetical protein n=1 Tax=Prosthecobacter sp. TaxID=1965333 RepID=UPI003782E9AF